MKQRTAIVIFLAGFLALPVFAERIAMDPLAMPTAESNGFGGHHTAYTDNIYSLLVNPAAMMRTRQWSFLNGTVGLRSPQIILDSGRAAIKAGLNEDMDAIGDALQDMSDRTKGKVPLGFELSEFPFSLVYVANGFGMGLWSHAAADINIRGTWLEAAAYADIMLPVGFAFKVLDTDNHSIDAGVTLKPFVRSMVSERESMTTVAGDTEKYAEDFVDNLNVPIIVGGALDAGLLYRWNKGLQAGFTFNDIYSRGEAVYNSNPDTEDKDTYYFPFTMNAGLSYHFDLAFLGITAAADWHDVGNYFRQDDYSSRNWILDLSAGVEVSLFKAIYLRAGMRDMLPSAGLGVKIGVWHIDMAYYGRELGNEPGQFSVPTLEISGSFRLGAKEKDRFWTRGSLVGLFTGGN